MVGGNEDVKCHRITDRRLGMEDDDATSSTLLFFDGVGVSRANLRQVRGPSVGRDLAPFRVE